MTSLTLTEIARHLDGIFDGDDSMPIERVRGFEYAGANEIAVVSDPRLFAAIDTSSAAALVIPQSCSASRRNLIRVPDARRALGPLIRLFASPEAFSPGIEAGAHVEPTARIGERAFIAAGAHLGHDVVLGNDVRIHANAVVGAGSLIGNASVIHPNVTIYPGTRIGRRVIIHAGAVIGSDGFGYTMHPDGIEKIPQVGIVEIEDDVEVGANCTIDRATLEVTLVRAGTKIDNLVQIGHNSEIGRNVVVVAQVGISGSVTIGDGAMLGGQVGIADHVKVGPGVVVGAQSGVHADIATGEWLGTPALPRERAGRMFAVLPHLPDYRERVRVLEVKVEELQNLFDRLQNEREVAHSKLS